MVKSVHICLCIVAALCALPAFAATAQATPKLVCSGTEALSYSPGITNTPSMTALTINENLAPCLSLADPTITAGLANKTISLTTSCTQVLVGSSGTRTFHWSNGQTSTFAFNYVNNVVGGTLVMQEVGQITAGEFSGSAAIGLVEDLGSPVACTQPGGLTNKVGPDTFTVL
jgi:hypothetical protein